MKIETIQLKNFKNFKDIEISHVPNFCIFVGANGSGKSAFFSVFAFLHEAFKSDVNTALIKIAGSKGFQEVRTRGEQGPIEITLKFRMGNDDRLLVYYLCIAEKNGGAFVEKEHLVMANVDTANSWGFTFKRERNSIQIPAFKAMNSNQFDERIFATVKSDDILAIKGLSQFEPFQEVVRLGEWIEGLHISELQISKTRSDPVFESSKHLTRHGDNLSLVVADLYTNYPQVFQKIIEKLKASVPGITQVESKITEDGRVLLKFQDSAFKEPFLAHSVSSGTIKMLAYLVLLYDPNPYPILCVEEPENQLYPSLLEPLAERFREYTSSGSQVFVSTHSQNFLNAAELGEVFWLEKNGGHSTVVPAIENEQLRTYMDMGDKLGRLWREGFFGNADPA